MIRTLLLLGSLACGQADVSDIRTDIADMRQSAIGEWYVAFNLRFTVNGNGPELVVLSGRDRLERMRTYLIRPVDVPEGKRQRFVYVIWLRMDEYRAISHWTVHDRAIEVFNPGALWVPGHR